jgi:uncharacterized membrane protein
MSVLLLGLVLFLAAHSVRIVADGWRSRMIARLGEGPWKGVYSVLSLAGFALIVWGYGLARQQPVPLWDPPAWTRQLAALLMLGSFVLLAAAYVPRNGLKARLHHPMVLSVKVWALAHLLANGTLADVVLFGAFLAWSVLDYRSARLRDEVAGTSYPAGSAGATAVAVVVGLVAWAVFAFWAHHWLFGVPVYG